MTSYYTIGVAGHVDHGKTALTRALTGINTDRMREEQRKGLSIVPGIAPLTLPSGVKTALVDLPGHSDYLKNTICGLAGIDMAILVVSADEGVMPQTREHLNILKFYGIKRGVIVLSKTDIVEGDILELADLEIRELMEESGFSQWPVLPFSALTKTGLKEVVSCIDGITGHLKSRCRQVPFRLWVDQARMITGFGTVISGTILAGVVNQNDTVQLFPDGRKVRVRFLETHGEKVETLAAGQRAGINLPRVPLGLVKKGSVLATPDTLSPTAFINAELHLLENLSAALRDRTRVRLYIGTASFNCLAVLMDAAPLSSGQTGLVQFRPSRPIPCMPGDRFVVAILNKNVIIGGGRILGVSQEKFRRAKAAKMIPVLEAIQKENLPGYLNAVSANAPFSLISVKETASRTPFSEADIAEEINRGVNRNKWIRISRRDGVLKKDHYDWLLHHVLKVCERVLTGDNLKQKFQINEIADSLDVKVSQTLLVDILRVLCQRGSLAISNGYYQLTGSTEWLSADHQKTITALLNFAENAGWKPFSAGHFCKVSRGQYSKRNVEKLLLQLALQNKLIQLAEDRYIAPHALEAIKARMKDFLEQQDCFSIHDCQSVLGYGRTQAIHVLEYLDDAGFTKREGNVRTLHVPDVTSEPSTY